MNRELFWNRWWAFFPAGPPRGWVTYLFATAAVLVGCLTEFGADREARMPLALTTHRVEAHLIQWRRGLPEIRQGEVWRLVTPIFVHLSALHLATNLFLLIVLGNVVEAREGRLALVGLFFACGIVAAFASYFAHGPGGHGMSGALAGLTGYVWARGLIDRASLYRDWRAISTVLVVTTAVPALGLRFAQGGEVAHWTGLVCGGTIGAVCALVVRSRAPCSV